MSLRQQCHYNAIDYIAIAVQNKTTQQRSGCKLCRVYHKVPRVTFPKHIRFVSETIFFSGNWMRRSPVAETDVASGDNRLIICPDTSVRSSFRLSFRSSVRRSVRPSVVPSVSLSVRPSIRPSIRLSIRPSVATMAHCRRGPSSPIICLAFRFVYFADAFGCRLTRGRCVATRFLTVRPSIRPPALLPTRPSVRPFVHPSASPFVRPSVHPFVRSFVCPSIRSSVRPSVRPSVCPSVRPSIRPSIRLSIRPSVATMAHCRRGRWSPIICLTFRFVYFSDAFVCRLTRSRCVATRFLPTVGGIVQPLERLYTTRSSKTKQTGGDRRRGRRIAGRGDAVTLQTGRQMKRRVSRP